MLLFKGSTEQFHMDRKTQFSAVSCFIQETCEQGSLVWINNVDIEQAHVEQN